MKLDSLLAYLVTNIVDYPESVAVKEEVNEDFQFTNLILTVHRDDMGKVIGKNGKIIRSLRTLLRVPAKKKDWRVNIQLEEPDENRRESGT